MREEGRSAGEEKGGLDAVKEGESAAVFEFRHEQLVWLEPKKYTGSVPEGYHLHGELPHGLEFDAQRFPLLPSYWRGEKRGAAIGPSNHAALAM